LSFTFLTFAVSAKDTPFHLITQIPIKGQGGWDYLSIDAKNHRLFVSHSDRIVVVDTEKNQIIKEILNTPGIHGVAAASDLNKAFSSDGKEGMVGVIELTNLTLKSKIKVGENPDTILYEPSQHEVYAFNNRGNSVSVIDAKSEKVIATIPLPGRPEFGAVDVAAKKIYVNIEDKNSIVSIDTLAHKVVSTWPLPGCEGPSGLALNTKSHHLYSVCVNEKMVMIDSNDGHLISSAETGKGTDAAEFDPDLNLAFSSNGKSGTITVVKDLTDKLSVVENVKSQLGARTMILDPIDHHLYLITADFKPAKEGKRPKPVDGTQRVLVYGQ